MFEIVPPLVFQRVKALVFNLPPGATGTHHRLSVFLGDHEIGYPIEFGNSIVFINLPIFKKVNQQILI